MSLDTSVSDRHTITKIRCTAENLEDFKTALVGVFNVGKLYTIEGIDGTNWHFNFKVDRILTLSITKTEIRAVSKANTLIISLK